MDHFIHSLGNEVTIVKELPSQLSWSSREYYGTGIRATRIKTAPVQASASWYQEKVLPVLQRLLSFYSYAESCCLKFYLGFSWHIL